MNKYRATFQIDVINDVDPSIHQYDDTVVFEAENFTHAGALSAIWAHGRLRDTVVDHVETISIKVIK
jgi:hypothetical protein